MASRFGGADTCMIWPKLVDFILLTMVNPGVNSQGCVEASRHPFLQSTFRKPHTIALQYCSMANVAYTALYATLRARLLSDPN